MPELPDITVYIERLEAYIRGQPLEKLRIHSPFVLRSVSPPVADIEGQRIKRIGRLGKRIVFEFENRLQLVIHLMIAGRLRWKKKGTTIPARNGLAGFDFPDGTLILTEASTKKRASIYILSGPEELKAHDRGGLEVMKASTAAFKNAILAENHTLKRTLTDPRILSAIGNAYSDEILFSAKMSPFKLSHSLSDSEIAHLHQHVVSVLERFTNTIRQEVGNNFPDKVTAFREDMFVHGRHRKPCKVCGSTIQRVNYAESEMNYCATCQNAGKLLADRSLSRLLKKDWPRTVEELEQRRGLRPPKK
ncbi:MAG: formamidopyrimidine-DNA glycosylase [Myxococcales bacterium]|nr:formamidopyrimidine-DNA glycosylase [Myxococcales bacterium]